MSRPSCRLVSSLPRRRASRKFSPRNPPPRRSLVTLAIETSCDDTAVCVLERSRAAPHAALLFNERISSDNRAYGGIWPSIAVQGHSASLAPLLRRAVAALPRDKEYDGRGGRPPDFVSVTRGPGMMANLGIGLSAAKALAAAWDVPLVGVHHMQAHALTPRLVGALGMPMGPGTDAGAGDMPDFPFLSLLVSGGHTQLVHSASLTDHRIVAASSDNAVGNLLDHVARVILPPDVLRSCPDVSYGRQLEAFAFPGPDPAESYAFFRPALSRRDEMVDTPTGYAWTVPQPFRQSRRLAYSFASIYTDVHRIAAENPSMDLAERRALARHTMASTFAHLAGRLCLALEDRPSLRPAARTVVVSGGVASNRFLMHVLRTTLAARGWPRVSFLAPPPHLCTDNAAMIAWAGMEMFEAGFHTDLSVTPIAKWPLDPDHGLGLLGVPGWLRREGGC